MEPDYKKWPIEEKNIGQITIGQCTFSLCCFDKLLQQLHHHRLFCAPLCAKNGAFYCWWCENLKTKFKSRPWPASKSGLIFIIFNTNLLWSIWCVISSAGHSIVVKEYNPRIMQFIKARSIRSHFQATSDIRSTYFEPSFGLSSSI